MKHQKCDRFSNATCNINPKERYVTFAIPDNVLDWAAEDQFGVSTDELMSSSTFQSVLKSHYGCGCGNGSTTIGEKQYSIELPNRVDTVNILSGPVFDNGIETYIIDGIVLSRKQLNNINEELDGLGNTGKMRKWARKVEIVLKETESTKYTKAKELENIWYEEKFCNKRQSRRVKKAHQRLGIFLDESERSYKR